MADFCKDCGIAMFGEDHKDMANLMRVDDYTPEMGALCLCECCGPVVVDITGKRMNTDFDPECHCGEEPGHANRAG